jgi:hypothetical protein
MNEPLNTGPRRALFIPASRGSVRVTKTSLRFRLFGVWALSLLACIAVGVLLVQLHQQSTEARVGRADALIARACDLIHDRYSHYAAKWSAPAPALSDQKLRRDLATAVSLALAQQNGVEGGIWQVDAGPLAYAFPTYAGTGPKTDLPAAERHNIQAVNEQAARDQRAVNRRSVSREQTLLLYACPLSGPIPRLTAWTMTRVEAVPNYGRLRLGLVVLLGFMVLMSAWLGWVPMVWARHLSAIEATLGSTSAPGIPTLAPTGERELAINIRSEAARRLDALRKESQALAARLSHVERLAIGILGTIIAPALLAALATSVSPGSVLGSDTAKLAAGAIFAGAYLALAIGKIPGLSSTGRRLPSSGPVSWSAPAC